MLHCMKSDQKQVLGMLVIPMGVFLFRNILNGNQLERYKSSFYKFKDVPRIKSALNYLKDSLLQAAG